MSGARSLSSFGALKFMRGNILVITITRAMGMFCRRMVFPYASLYILALGGEPGQIGLINSLSPLAGLLMFPLGGYLADRAGRVILIAVAGYLSAAIQLLYILAPSWHWIALARFVQGFMVFQFPPSSAIIADSLPPEGRGRGLATMNTLVGSVAIIAPYLAGSLLDVRGEITGMRVLYGVMMVYHLVSATIHLRFLKETSSQSREKLGFANLVDVFKRAYSGIPATLGQFPRSLKAMTAVLILGFVSNGIAASYWVVYAKEQIGLSSSQWGLVLLIEASLRSLIYIPVGMAVDRWGRTRCIQAALLLALVSVPAFVFAGGFVHVLLIRAVVAAASAFFTTACSALMADSIPREMRGRVMAAIGRGTVMIGATGGGTGGPGVGFVITIPLMLSSLAGGYLYTYNVAYPWFLSATATAISIAVVALFVRDPHKAEA